MAKLGVITDGISRDFEQALAVINETGLTCAELQYLWDVEVGDLSDAQLDRVQRLVAAHGVEVSCISRHIFGGLALGELETDSPAYMEQLAALQRCIDMAKALDSPLVRIMSFRKEMILFGSQGAEQWVVSRGAWDKLKAMLLPALEIAAERGLRLVVETGNNAMINSAWLARKLIDELSSEHLQTLWDPANSLYCAESPYPAGYEALRGSGLGHIHIKDVLVDMPKARVDCVPLGSGQMAPYLEQIAVALAADGYAGSVSLESVYRPHAGSFADGFRASIDKFKALFS
ncbi:MAG: sugar phosphate isomerase/epimerase [Chloroflexi bacterium]|nr:sugar phosphate isomerase/epimerase [Chloroflexota bacterium]